MNELNQIDSSIGNKENKSKTFYIIIVLALFVLGVFLGYLLKFNNTDITIEKPEQSDVDNQTVSIDTSKLHSKIDIDYPDTLSQKTTEVILSHFVPYENTNFCNFKGEKEQINKEFVDYRNRITLIELPYMQAIRYHPDLHRMFLDGDGIDLSLNVQTVDVNGTDVYFNFAGAEGCGRAYYVIPAGDNTILVENDLIPPFAFESPYRGPWPDEVIEEYRNIPGVILPEEANVILNDILKQLVNKI